MNMPHEVECVIIGAGIVGLAIARELIQLKKEVLVIEKNEAVGLESSFRNSAVLHAGLYYPPQSLKAVLCREGQTLLYDYCLQKQIPFHQTGKLIVVSNQNDVSKLKQLHANALANDVTTLHYLTRQEVKRIEPQICAYAALHSPTTGVIDGRALLAALASDIKAGGGHIIPNMPFVKGQIDNKKIRLQMGQEENVTLTARYLVNAAGLYAIKVANSLAGMPKQFIPQQYYAKGNYFKLTTPTPFKKLIYPLPEQAGLGIHATIDLNETTRFGPDVEWVENLDYKVSHERIVDFYKAIRNYYPALPDGALVPDTTGIRPKISPAQAQPQDFIIQSAKTHGIKNLIHLFGIESPGLTASLAIAKKVGQFMFPLVRE